MGVLQRQGDLLNSIDFMPDGKSFLTSSDDGTVAVFACGLPCEPIDIVITAAQTRDEGPFRLIDHGETRSCR